jgi:hypothetical protein
MCVCVSICRSYMCVCVSVYKHSCISGMYIYIYMLYVCMSAAYRLFDIVNFAVIVVIV